MPSLGGRAMPISLVTVRFDAPGSAHGESRTRAAAAGPKNSSVNSGVSYPNSSRIGETSSSWGRHQREYSP